MESNFMFEGNVPEKVGIHPNIAFKIILPNKSISLFPTGNNIKFKKLDIDINSMNYTKSS